MLEGWEGDAEPRVRQHVSTRPEADEGGDEKMQRGGQRRVETATSAADAAGAHQPVRGRWRRRGATSSCCSSGDALPLCGDLLGGARVRTQTVYALCCFAGASTTHLRCANLHTDIGPDLVLRAKRGPVDSMSIRPAPFLLLPLLPLRALLISFRFLLLARSVSSAGERSSNPVLQVRRVI